ncbi:conserved hypothetical protein [Vibrio crassostreae]|nr:conserved hypothetical protein [Vibrio crassostreae]
MKTDSEILEQANTHTSSSKAGTFITERFEEAQHNNSETNSNLVMTKIHSGREFYVNQANKEIYTTLMGEEPTELDGRVISEHAAKKGIAFIKSQDSKLTECMDGYKSICHAHQDTIDEQLENLQMFDVPVSAEELENQLEATARKAGVSLKSIRKIKQARENEASIKAYEAVGIVPTKDFEREESKVTSKRVEILRQQRGRGKIHASLLLRSECSDEYS